MKRIFLRALSRSGGTLMAKILDAHPDIAMGYELYDHLLEPLASRKFSADTHPILRFVRRPSRRCGLIAGRALRGGVDGRNFNQLVWDHIDNGEGFDSFAGRMLFVEKLVDFKRRQEGKLHWGAIVLEHDQLRTVFPSEQCYFLFMQRDGRDVAASQKHVGDFKKEIRQIAKAWSKQTESFHKFCRRNDVNARVIRYETLAEHPEQVCLEIANFLGLTWSGRMLQSHNLDLSIHRNTASHLSADQIRQCINTKSIGRYKYDLTPDELAVFNDTAKSTLEALGYSA